MESLDVGKKVEKFRKDKGYSLRELSRLTDITPSMLSQIERGLANPSLQTLKVLAGALDIPIFHFFLEERETSDLIVKKQKRRKMIVDNLTYELLSPDFSGELETVVMKIPQGVASSNEPIGHKGEEIAFVLNGTVQLYLGDSIYQLEEGDSVKIPAFMKHKWENLSQEDVTVVFSVTPPSF
ncbi:helix-turn-helix domain-containing protein [Bacillus massiliigorillae]|uniref:helix-turn-helix domain-containing protein n=1 Tax=Bacillus massiliigorillae TaxID=1243664 RepID=UPI0003A4E6CF|nr:XRE family transcriptional regulator [Bacillus massiliigorillae]